MGRYYRLSKALSEAEASEIMREVREIEEVDEAEYSEGYTRILVFTKKEKYPEVMTRIVNIISRVGQGCELSFARADILRKGIALLAFVFIFPVCQGLKKRY